MGHCRNLSSESSPELSVTNRELKEMDYPTSGLLIVVSRLILEASRMGQGS